MNIRTVFRRLDDWAFGEIAPHGLALFRIGFGLFLLFYWGRKLPHVPVMFADQGLHLPMQFAVEWIDALLLPPPAWVAWIIFGTFLMCLFGLTVGCLTRACSLVAFLIYLYLWGLTLHLFPTSYDRIFIFVLLVLGFSRADRTLSVHMWRRAGSVFAWQPITALPQRLLQLQIAATYLGVGWQKLVLPDWQGGEILSYSLVGNWGSALGYWIVRQNWPMVVYDWGVFLVMCFELSIPFGLWIRKWKIQWWFFAGGLLFHGSIALLMNIWWFLVLVPAYVIYLDPESVRAWVERRSGSSSQPFMLAPRQVHPGRHSIAARLS